MKTTAIFMEQDNIIVEIKTIFTMRELKSIQKALSESNERNWNVTTSTYLNQLYDIANKVRTEVESNIVFEG